MANCLLTKMIKVLLGLKRQAHNFLNFELTSKIEVKYLSMFGAVNSLGCKKIFKDSTW
jgi:hypothetical protein